LADLSLWTLEKAAISVERVLGYVMRYDFMAVDWDVVVIVVIRFKCFLFCPTNDFNFILFLSRKNNIKNPCMIIMRGVY